MAIPLRPVTGARCNETSNSAATDSLTLLRRAQRGDGDALNTLLQRYLPALTRWAAGRLPRWARDLADTDDIVQETVLRTLRRLDTFEPTTGSGLHWYLRQAIWNRIRDEIRRTPHRPVAGPMDSDLIAVEPSPFEQAVGREVLDRYELSLSRLEPHEREAVVMRLEFGYTFAEIATATSRPTADAARKLVERAVVRLAAAMESLAHE